MKEILKSVSRSFYLTIQFLPRPLREPVSLGYLLARATDTIADTASIPAATRLTILGELNGAIQGEREFATVELALRDFNQGQRDPHERRLVENLRAAFKWLGKIEPADRADIRAVLKTIVSGQQLDLERFGDPSNVGSLQTAAELEQYTYLVAGCVGDFWTKLGFRRLPPFALRAPNEMATLGIAYGKGLQLVNVLRDRPADLRNGRDYLPAEELAGTSVEEVFFHWLGRAGEGLDAGIEYCVSLTNWRVRFATMLPALIGASTIALLRRAGLTQEKIKVPRSEVRRILRNGLAASISPGRLRGLYDRLLSSTVAP